LGSYTNHFGETKADDNGATTAFRFVCPFH
jgi:hypothetical protein